MTIKELEERTGMTRANIRFYEDEGLLTPQRLPNGYRDYSEEDVLTLEKISLLRQLHLDINTIRLVQDGTLTLEQALFSQRNRLEGDKALIDRALEVCKKLEQSRVEYAALEARPWLEELKRPAQPKPLNAPSAPPPMSDADRHYYTHRAYEHPWMRYFARGVDLALYTLLIHFVLVVCFGWRGVLRASGFGDWLLGLAALLLMFLCEPLWLHYLGWTPGKWIFGLKLRDKNGEKLSLQMAWERGWQIAWKGYGLNIPIYSLWRHYKSYRCYRDDEDCNWDIWLECRYTREDRRLYGLWWVACHAFEIAAIVLIVLFAFLPANRGGLTVEEYAENYNQMLVIQGLSDYYDKLDPDGTWEDPAPGVYVIGFSETTWKDPVYTLEDGEITSVTFQTVSTGSRASSIGTRAQVGLLAFTGALDGINVFTYWGDDWLEQWTVIGNADGAWTDFERDYKGVRITRKVEMQGYEDYFGSLYAIEGETQSCTQTVTISLIGNEP